MQFSGLENTPVFIGQARILLLYLAASFFQVFCYWISFELCVVVFAFRISSLLFLVALFY